VKRFLAILLGFFGMTLSGYGQEFTIKFATVAPEGSTWMNIMREYDATIRKESGGRVGFRVYAGQVMGDESAVLRKIRVGQLQAGGFTGVGLGDVAPMVRILDTPFLVHSPDETDYLTETFGKEFEAAFEEGGYILLGWAEVGFVHVFTKKKISKPEDLSTLKMWTWEGDPVAAAAFSALDMNPIPLSITDVYSSLQTGLIDAFYTPPLAALALQWFTQVKYVVSVPLANSAGAVLLSKRYFDKMPKDLQEIVLRNGRKYMAELTTLSRQDNAKAMETLVRQGIEKIPVEAKDLGKYVNAGEEARQALAGKMYSKQFLERVEQALRSYRAEHGASR
jgi:TRAP-type C4-dicarboxylate transport system substrate-binding protein